MHKHDYDSWSNHRHLFFAHAREGEAYKYDTRYSVHVFYAAHRPRLFDRIADLIWVFKEWAKEWRW